MGKTLYSAMGIMQAYIIIITL